MKANAKELSESTLCFLLLTRLHLDSFAGLENRPAGRMQQPQRKSSWSFSLRDDEWSSDESQGDQQQQQLVQAPAVAEQDRLLAEAEQEGVAEYPEPELFDISLVEEGDVRFLETPFTIARRVAATRKRAQGTIEEVEEQVSAC